MLKSSPLNHSSAKYVSSAPVSGSSLPVRGAVPLPSSSAPAGAVKVGAGRGGQDQGQGEGQGGGPPGLGDAADPVLQLPLPGGHGSGGEEGVAAGPPHRHQGQQGPAVGQPLLLVQPRQHRLVAGQLPVG